MPNKCLTNLKKFVLRKFVLKPPRSTAPEIVHGVKSVDVDSHMRSKEWKVQSR